MLNNIHISNETEELPGPEMQNKIELENANEMAKIKIMPVPEVIRPNETGQSLTEKAIAASAEIIPVLKTKPVYNFTGKTVLIVDDVSFNLTLLALFFKTTGAQILFAANGMEAVDVCILNPHVDIVLMDIQMPVMNGLEATVEIQKLKPGLPVIAITAFVHSDDKQRCFDAGCVDFLPKPCNRENLLMTVSSYF